jgi:hypothetical protein
MNTYALIGKSGTGKSYHALEFAKAHCIEAIIDDGLLISCGKILAGSSAKHEKTRMASVKRALFFDNDHVLSVKSALNKSDIDSVLILGTSLKMVNQICHKLDLPEFKEIFNIEGIASKSEIETANIMRNKYGKHIIPLPVFEVKKQFSGYLLNALKIQGRHNPDEENTIVRPTYSYLGNFRISPQVFYDICKYEISKLPEVCNIYKIKSISDTNGFIDIYLEIGLVFPCDIPWISHEIQKIIQLSIEALTSIIVKNVNIFIKSIKID